MLPDCSDLGHLACNAQDAGTGLQIAQRVRIDYGVGEKRDDTDGERCDEESGDARPAAVVENQNGNDDILAQDEGRLAEGAEREAISNVVGQRDEVGGRLEEVGQKGHARRGLRLDQLDDLRHLDDRGRADDADAQSLGDS